MWRWGEEIRWRGPAVIAVDGDREIKLREGEEAVLTVERDGPWMIDVQAVMRQAVTDGLF